MRIISGKWKGKRLESPEGKDIRPTSDRTREALFNLLIHLDENPLIAQPVMDICCGSGALGLEALSRGASHCHFVDNGQQALRLVQHHIDLFGARTQAKVLQANASALPHAPEPMSLIMMDPPYQHTTLVEATYASLQAQGWLRAGTIISVEQSKKNPPPPLEGTEIIKQRAYGRSEITLFRVL
jgi:16S rRNA (guanine966-N2)-methyltransferase